MEKAVVKKIWYGGKGLNLEKRVGQIGEIVATGGIDQQNVRLRFCDGKEYWFYINEVKKRRTKR